ncbi:MAG: SpoIIE family protein phosphatase [Spirochaetales bacterium]|nr:SpoIIE family protein phosphatase [Spirochaetales bacterium]
MIIKKKIEYDDKSESGNNRKHLIKVLKRYVPERDPAGRKISRIATQFYYVRHDERIEDLADDIKENDTIRAICIVDKANKPIGAIIVNDLLNLLSRPYGRDVLRNHPVTEVKQQVQIFLYDRNILSVAELIYRAMKAVKTTYYCLVKHDGTFAGIFSTRNMLVYLSEMTRKDIILAKTVQGNIVKDHECIETSGFKFLGFVCMAKEVGGDFYYIKEYEKKKWIIAICDVSGKGVAAALVTSVIGGMMNIFDYSKGLDFFISKLNDYIYHTFGLDRFVTGIFLHFDEDKGNITFYDFGHSYMYILKDNSLTTIKNKEVNLPLGILANTAFRENQISLKKGECLLLLTDGFFDQTNDSKKAYSLRRIAALVKKMKDEPLLKLKTSIMNDFHRYRESQPQIDDVTFVMLKF